MEIFQCAVSKNLIVAILCSILFLEEGRVLAVCVSVAKGKLNLSFIDTQRILPALNFRCPLFKI